MGATTSSNALVYGLRENVRHEIPDYAIDGHTARGRQMGRTEQNHYEESYGLVNQTLYDRYVGLANPWMDAEQVKRLAEPHDEHPAS